MKYQGYQELYTRRNQPGEMNIRVLAVSRRSAATRIDSSHILILSGIYPARHAIIANKPFDPLRNNLDGWRWYSEDIKVSTLWDVATQAGLVRGV